MECSMCGGPLAYLGAFGNRRHFRCTGCGLGASYARQQLLSWYGIDPQEEEGY